MAVHKNAFIRYQALDRCFRNSGRKYRFKDLLKEVNKTLEDYDPGTSGVQRRQLYDDIAFMMSDAGFNAPILREQDGKYVNYTYEDPSFSINNQPINETEANQIKSALMILGRFKGMPQFEWVDEISTKISSALNMEAGMEDIISFDSNEYLKGINFLGELFNAIHYKKVLVIKYNPFIAPAFESVIHPYYLKQYNNRWFLLGWKADENFIITLALDRIESIKEKSEKYISAKENFDEYFEDIIGISRPKDSKITTIELLFSNDEAPYILTKPLHGSQAKIKHDENGLMVRLKIIPNFEFERLILGFGEKVEVLKPVELRNKFKMRIELLNELYNH